ncbi:MAG TPA: type 2 lanthipeptide synthetase LanM family protein [Ktedonobacteraceae bacterium]|nr:type 2 lanthipeptide synthetase LanM family protein [Ktedonobacteraceae bacterium]
MIDATTKSIRTWKDIISSPTWYNALTLKERLASWTPQDRQHTEVDTISLERAKYKFNRWKELPAFKEASFSERLMLDNLTEDELFMILTEPAAALQARTAQIPDWLLEIGQALSDAALLDMVEVLASLGLPEDRIESFRKTFQQSFLVILQPLIVRGVKRLQAGIEALSQEYPTLPCHQNTLLAAWLENLPAQLLYKLNRTLALELHVARLEKRLQGDTPEERFQNFVRQLNQSEYRQALLEEYAPLTRLLMQTIEHWLRYGLEFFQHLCADWNDICTAFFASTHPGELVEAKSGLGDQHKSGRSTLKLRFASGKQLIYKPRSMQVDSHFQELLAWLNAHGDHPPFRITKILNRGTYGWSEFIEAGNCQSQEEVQRFYERQGAYLALLYALNAVDFHYENLIAAGEDPVLIDLESLFHPDLRFGNGDQPNALLFEKMDSSVLRVGLLPVRIWANGQSKGVDLSGLGGQAGQQTPRPVLQFTDSGTDAMRFIRKHQEIPAQNNRPKLQEQDVDVLDYCEALIIGFSHIYQLLRQHREEILKGPLAAFANDEIRVIVRPTQTYALLLHESLHPDLLRNTLDRDYFFDRLWQQAPKRPDLIKVIAAERDDLHDGDIPMFTTTPTTRDILTSRGVRIANFCAVSSMEKVTERLQGLGEADLERQIWFIRASLATVHLNQGHVHKRATRISLASEPALITRERLLQAACKIGDRLQELALCSEGEAQWLCLSLVSEREWQVLPAGIDLYNGVPGIAFFLAYLGALTGNTRYRKLAEDAIQNIQRQFEYVQDMLKLPGVFSGLGAMIYLYTHLGILWQDARFLELAEEIALRSLEVIEEDKVLDFMAGTASYISALLSLYHVRPSAQVLAAAQRAGLHLITSMGELQPGIKPHFGIEASRPLTGLSHGMAGYALSLLRLAHVNDDQRYRQAALAAIEYERAVFSSTEQNWPDFREEDGSSPVSRQRDENGHTFMTTWCHGAAGIGLARLASLKYMDDPLIREEIRIALSTTLRDGFGWCHSLCHGDLGNLDVLLTAWQTLHDPFYKQQMQRILAEIMKAIEVHGYVTGAPFGLEVPGLMVGIAGIGYQFLRLCTPERIPSILTLEPPVLYVSGGLQ